MIAEVWLLRSEAASPGVARGRAPRTRRVARSSRRRWLALAAAALGMPGGASAQLGPEYPAGGFLSAEAVRIEDLTSRCMTEIEPGPAEVVTYASCALVGVDSIVGGPVGAIFAARYLRWIRSPDVTWVDSLQVDEVVLFEASAVDDRTARPIWHRVGYDNFLGPLEWHTDGAMHLLQLYNCVRGTGGCVEEVLLRDQTGWTVVELAFIGELGPHVPPGFALHKGRQIDLSTLGFEQPIAGPDDPNCCPSATLVGALRLEGGRLRLESVQRASVAADPDARWSIDEAKVVFTARRDGTSDIYLFDRAAQETTRLTAFGTPEGGANAPRPSADGSALALQVRRGQDYEVHVLDLTTDESTNVSNHPEYDVSPAWSPDGTRVAFMSTRGYELGGIGPFPGHIYVFDLTARSLWQLTREPLTSSLGPSDWAPDGSSLLLARLIDGRAAVFSIDASTGAEARVTDTPASEYSATYSRAGDRLAFHSEADGASQIVIADLDGSNRRTLTSGPGLRYYPRWSPDDRWLLFTASDDGEQYDLRAVRVEDGLVIDVVATPEDEREGDWIWPGPDAP